MPPYQGVGRCCVHFSASDANGCKAGLSLVLQIRHCYNAARGWLYGVPAIHKEDWEEALPCIENNKSPMFECPFLTYGELPPNSRVKFKPETTLAEIEEAKRLVDKLVKS